MPGLLDSVKMPKVDADLNWWVYLTLRRGNHMKIVPVVSKYPSKLSLDDISKPKDYKHIFHVGVDGKVEGDPTFGGDYRNIPKSEEEEEGSSPSRSSSGRSDSKSSTPSKSPAKSKKNNNNKRNVSSPVIELSKETILPPPNGFDSGSTVSVPDVIPSVSAQQSSAPPPSLSTKEALPPPLSSKAPIAAFAEPELTYTTNGSSSHSNRDVPPKTRDGGKSSTVSSPEDLSLPSTFEMGSLLDDMMSVWDSAKLNLGFSDSLETTPEETEEGAMADEDDSQSLLEGEENALCNGDASLSPSINRVGEVNPVAVEPVSVVQAVQEQEAGASRNAALVVGVEGAEEERGAVGGAGGAAVGGAAVVSKGAEGGLLPGSIIIKDTMTKPTKTYRKAPRQPQNGSAETNGGVVKPDSQPPEPPQAARSRPGRDMNIAKQMSRDKRWDNEFKRLSSTSPKDQSLENDYIDTQNMQQRQSRSSEEYEELALASSPQPYTLRDSVLDSANVQRVTRCPPDVVTRSISMRTARPNVEALQAQASAELSRSRSLREPPISPLGQEAYDSLVGGAICSNQQRPRLESEEKRAPAVPPKPAPKPPSRSKSLQSSSSRNSDVRSSGSGSYRSYSGASSDDATSEDASSSSAAQGELPGNRGAVASLRQRFNSNPDTTVPPRPPPRESSDVKVSTFTGVRLRRREQSNGMSESYYASEHENNNATPASIKINSPPTASGLEHQLPRRTRRSVGEDRIRRRSSSDASDSDTETARPGSGSDRLGLAAGSRTSEGDSSSDETLASPKRLSSSSNERSAFSVERDAVSGYRSPPRPLYDLPEDQSEIILL